jgi:acetyltransferase-like isoleucine patch superfamily enzyme
MPFRAAALRAPGFVPPRVRSPADGESMSTFNRAVNKLSRFIQRPVMRVDDLVVGREVLIEPGVEIICKRLVLGDGVVIKSGTRIEMTDLVVGDYTKFNNHGLLTGTDSCRIGHNCWFGHYTIVDSIGTTSIGNGVGVGAHSQLWTHAYFGDTLDGCRFATHAPLVIEDEVWLVGHCILSPIRAGRRSMAMVGSVVTKDMEADHVYAGVPARDVTDRFGPQFETVPLETKRRKLEAHLEEFLRTHRPERNRIAIVDRIDMEKRHLSQFSVSERLYVKNLYPEEVAFMRFLLPTKAKFRPHPDTDWVRGLGA